MRTPIHWPIGFQISWYSDLAPCWGVEFRKWGVAGDLGKLSWGFSLWKSKKAREEARKLS